MNSTGAPVSLPEQRCGAQGGEAAVEQEGRSFWFVMLVTDCSSRRSDLEHQGSNLHALLTGKEGYQARPRTANGERRSSRSSAREANGLTIFQRWHRTSAPLSFVATDTKSITRYQQNEPEGQQSIAGLQGTYGNGFKPSKNGAGWLNNFHQKCRELIWRPRTFLLSSYSDANHAISCGWASRQ
jgi:hypothetical protein